MTNTDIAQQLQKHARTLALSHASLFRIRAYRRAATAILGLDRPAAEIGRRDLQRVPGIGDHLAVAIDHFARTGDWKTYEELTSAGLAV